MGVSVRYPSAGKSKWKSRFWGLSAPETALHEGRVAAELASEL